jgi:Na+/proline symporter
VTVSVVATRMMRVVVVVTVVVVVVVVVVTVVGGGAAVFDVDENVLNNYSYYNLDWSDLMYHRLSVIGRERKKMI